MRHSETLFSKNNDLNVTISNFKVLSVLGSGSFGTVFLVQRKDTKKIYAMKTLRK